MYIYRIVPRSKAEFFYRLHYKHLLYINLLYELCSLPKSKAEKISEFLAFKVRTFLALTPSLKHNILYTQSKPLLP